MIVPELSRLSMPIILAAWSVVVMAVVKPAAWLAMIYVGFAIVVGFRFLFLRKVEDDRTSFHLYNVSFF